MMKQDITRALQMALRSRSFKYNTAAAKAGIDALWDEGWSKFQIRAACTTCVQGSPAVHAWCMDYVERLKK